MMELDRTIEFITNKYGNPLEGSEHWNGDPIHIVYFLIERDYRDVMLYAVRSELEKLQAMNERLEDYEENVAKFLDQMRNK